LALEGWVPEYNTTRLFDRQHDLRARSTPLVIAFLTALLH
jgi:hypothetical protein